MAVSVRTTGTGSSNPSCSSGQSVQRARRFRTASSTKTLEKWRSLLFALIYVAIALSVSSRLSSILRVHPPAVAAEIDVAAFFKRQRTLIVRRAIQKSAQLEINSSAAFLIAMRTLIGALYVPIALLQQAPALQAAVPTVHLANLGTPAEDAS
jgi:hypothetical protein